MCGIAGVVRLHGRIHERDRVAVARMLRAQAHRGPDGEDCFADERVCLGHRRLAIIDLSDRGREPMSNEAGDVWVTFNGEIYNFRELRSDLVARGHVFRSSTDTEVLVHGYEEWGLEPLLSRLRGMFAFALYDARRQGATKFFLVRDRFGIKPLYCARGDDALSFSSELTALAASGAVNVDLDDDALRSFLELGSIPGPRTVLKNVEAIPGGHYVEIESARVTRRRYWKLDPEPGESESIPELVSEAVKLHLVSDVPLGVFSSGGIDSATLVALASASQQEPVTTLTVVFEDDGLSEARYARKIAERYRTDHHEVSLDANEFFDTLPRVFDAMDSPSVDGVNTYFVSQAAYRAGLKVVLSGLGGDEVFLGYPHYKTLSRLEPWVRALACLPRSMRAIVAASARAFARKDRLDYLEVPTATNLYRMFRGLFSPAQAATLMGDGTSGDIEEDEPPSSEKGESLLDVAVRFELEHYLQNQLLRDADAMSMAHSIEARVPFLDHRLVEAVARLPHTAKLSPRANKPLLLAVLADPLPRETWDRPKQGFTLPFRRFMLMRSSELREQCVESGLYQPAGVDDVWSAFEAGRMHWSRPWALVAFAAWRDRLRSFSRAAADEPELVTGRSR